ncbi:MAG: glycosyltransferase [Candidatus Saccharimonadales bacterium]
MESHSSKLSPKKVAIVHDWLIAGGAERVVLELHHMFPDAPIYTSYCTPEWRERLDNKVVTGFLQRKPFPRLRKFVPFLRIWWFSRLDLRRYDLVISTSGAEAKGINVPPSTPHIAYIHAPTHYYWSRYDEYMKRPGFGRLDPLARVGLKLLIKPLRNWDYKAAQRPTHLLANSTHTQAGVKKYYGRDSTVVHPPVDIERFNGASAAKRAGFVITGRQTPYKRVDLAVRACTQLNLPLTVVGDGPDNHRLRELAGPSITFTGFVAEKEVARLVSSAEAFLFPGVDDFGISPVEAMAAGTPVIAYKAGGALDYVTKTTGLFFNEQTVDSLAKALQSFNASKYSSSDIKKAAEAFSKEVFAKNMTAEVAKVIY